METHGNDLYLTKINACRRTFSDRKQPYAWRKRLPRNESVYLHTILVGLKHTAYEAEVVLAAFMTISAAISVAIAAFSVAMVAWDMMSTIPNNLSMRLICCVS